MAANTSRIIEFEALPLFWQIFYRSRQKFLIFTEIRLWRPFCSFTSLKCVKNRDFDYLSPSKYGLLLGQSKSPFCTKSPSLSQVDNLLLAYKYIENYNVKGQKSPFNRSAHSWYLLVNLRLALSKSPFRIQYIFF